jgi:hypothetical protein
MDEMKKEWNKWFDVGDYIKHWSTLNLRRTGIEIDLIDLIRNFKNKHVH